MKEKESHCLGLSDSIDIPKQPLYNALVGNNTRGSDSVQKLKFAVACVVLGIAAGQARADVTFHFIETGGNVLMQSSGVLNTANLVSVGVAGWGGVGIEMNTPPQSNIMGDTSAGDVDVAFGFNSGTDLSPWIGTMFTSSDFDWSSAGTTQFTTYFLSSGVRTPGIGVALDDLSGGTWTPNVSWSQPGSFASIGLVPGVYTITDAITRESITIRIGGASATAPEPSSLALFGIGVIAARVIRRRRQL